MSQLSNQPSPAPVPTASATTLPIIGTTRSRSLCAAVRNTIAPAVLGVMKSDELIAASQSAYLRFGGRNIDNPSHDLGRVRLGVAVNGIAHNLQVVQALLDDKKSFPDPPRTADDRLALQLRDELRSVAQRQNDALNIINGVLETDLLRKMLAGARGGPSIASGRHFFRDVAEAIGEQRVAIDHVETVLSPAVVTVAEACGEQLPP